VKLFVRIFLFLVATMFGSAAQAQFLAEWDVNGQPGNQATVPATYADPNVTASDITRGPGLTAAAQTNGFDSTGWTTSTSLDPDDYLEFTLTPKAGTSLSLTGVSFSFENETSFLDPKGPETIVIQYSLNDYSTNLDNLVYNDPGGYGAAGLGFGPPDVISTGPVTFRIYGYDADSSSAPLFLYGAGDQPAILVSGSVIDAPEPGTGGLLLAGLGIVIACRIRRRCITQ